MHIQGGDKLTLNLTGTTSPLTVQTTTTTFASTTSFPSPKNFPSPTSPSMKNNFHSLPPLIPTPYQESAGTTTQHAPNTVATPIKNSNNETVTVTHFSEQRGAMEKISVPSLNIMSSEIKSPKLDNQARAELEMKKKNANNPFLTLDSISPVTKISSTNPFRETSPIPQSPNSDISTSDASASSPISKTSPTNSIGPNPFHDSDSDVGPKSPKIVNDIANRAKSPNLKTILNNNANEDVVDTNGNSEEINDDDDQVCHMFFYTVKYFYVCMLFIVYYYFNFNCCINLFLLYL